MCSRYEAEIQIITPLIQELGSAFVSSVDIKLGSRLGMVLGSALGTALEKGLQIEL
jgi:hypothetical protein